jgi:hypothetical protein
MNAQPLDARSSLASVSLSRRDRRAVAMRAWVTRSDGSLVDVRLLDLSHDGCGVDSPVPLRAGERLHIGLHRFGTTSAVVRWAAGGKAGLEFAAEEHRRFDPAAPVERRHRRVAVDAEVTLRRSGQLNYRVRLHDVTPDGCKAEFVERPQIDEQLWVKFDGMEALEARVCWTGGAIAGLVFRRPIHPAVFDLLLRRLPQPNSAAA